MRLIDFVAAANIEIASTCFLRKHINKETWKSPDSKTINQIDHIRSRRGANIDSDDYLREARLRARISKLRAEYKVQNYSVDVLNNPAKRVKFHILRSGLRSRNDK